MKTISEIFENMRLSHERKVNKRMAQEIEILIDVRIKNDNLWIMCGERAISKVDGNITVDSLISQVDKVKESTLSYEQYGNKTE